MGLTRDHIVWAYRILLDRDPENEDVILPKMRGYQNTRDLRNDIVTSEEYQEKNRDYAQMNDHNLVIKEIEPGLRLAIDLADHAIGLNILRGRFELNEIEFVRRTLKPGQHVVDAGAHIGLFAMHMAAAVGPSGSVHCFEPFEANAACLELAIAENRFERRVILERAAVGAMHGTGQLIFAPATLNSGGAFIGAPGASVPAGHETLPVRLIALDEYPLPRPISFIKIDVEGAEPQALRGAARLLREDRPLILSEVHPSQLKLVSGITPAAFIAQIAELGYRCHLLGAGVPGAEVTDVQTSGVESVVFVPR
ncbi:MAG TPA: FkbM family methyltransferase [Vicinamibacterales bacterium]|nr:FkbM family methyltransferase [Vicinamibacterales bacterium]